MRFAFKAGKARRIKIHNVEGKLAYHFIEYGFSWYQHRGDSLLQAN